ncbi:MAG: D-alanine--D-alanine ligase [Ruminococcus sp.]|nr:D-alanine--D-alanine ligase [Candidatus Copronaster equi]
MKNALIIFGGVSSEHEVSNNSASYVIANTPTDKYNVIRVGITKEGRWFKYDGDVKNLPNDKWTEDTENLTPAIISPDRADGGLIVFGEKTEKIKIDVVFPVLHGKNGEDGTIQGFLQLAGIPFVGCDMLSSACSMDKVMTNLLADAAGIEQAKWLGLSEYEYNKDHDANVDKAAEYLGFPIFVKPANAGSSVGISKATDKESLKTAIEVAFKEDSKLVLEETIVGKEVECAVLGNEKMFASICGEIVPCNDFYDYEAKYINPASELHLPARISDETMKRVQKVAKKTYAIMGCSGLARVDFFVRNSDSKVIFNELNTIPGFTSISMYPKMCAASGIPYSELIDRLLTLAMEKWAK